jgi:hypothetical protein
VYFLLYTITSLWFEFFLSVLYNNLSVYEIGTTNSIVHNLVQQDMRNGPPYSQPDNFGGYNMAPPHLVQNPLNNGPFPIGALARPPSGTFSPPDFPSVASVDAYRQHHEVTAVVMTQLHGNIILK